MWNDGCKNFIKISDVKKVSVNTVLTTKYPIIQSVANTTSPTVIEYSTPEYSEIPSISENNGVITNLEGRVRFILHLSVGSRNNRTNLLIGCLRGGVQDIITGSPLYARNASGHNDTGVSIVFEFHNVVLSDTFEIFTRREAGAGNVTIKSGITFKSYLIIDQYKTIDVLTL